MSGSDPTAPITSLREAARLVAQHFPELAGEPLERLGAGSDHDAFVLGGRYVLRVPKHEHHALRLASEARLTEWLAGRLPLAIPRYERVARPARDRPHHLAAYRMLPGRPALGLEEPAIDLARVGARVGELLAVLHSCDVAHARACGVPEDDDPSREEWAAAALSDLRFARDHGRVGASEVPRWERYLEAPARVDDGAVCLVHGDLAAEHVLVEATSEPTGVIDWSDACIGDAARDLAGLVHWGGPRMVAAASERYGPIDGPLLARARWLAACRALADIVFGTRLGRAAYVDAGVRALAHVGA